MAEESDSHLLRLRSSSAFLFDYNSLVVNIDGFASNHRPLAWILPNSQLCRYRRGLYFPPRRDCVVHCFFGLSLLQMSFGTSLHRLLAGRSFMHQSVLHTHHTGLV